MLLTLLAAAHQPAVQPPVSVTPPPPFVRTIAPSLARLRPVDVRVRLLGGGQVLAEEQLRVGPQGANLRRTRQEGLPANCPDRGSRSETLSFIISPFLGDLSEAIRENPRARISIAWGRPSPIACSQGARTIELMEVTTLTPGQILTLEGDGGLRAELTILRP